MTKMTKMMTRMNKRTNHVKMAKIMTKLEREKMKAEMNQDVIDDLMGEYGDEEAEDELVDQVLAEAGVLNFDDVALPSQEPAQRVPQPVAAGGVEEQAQGGGDADVDDLEARMRNLNNNLPPDNKDDKGE